MNNNFQNRIVGHGEEPIDDILFNPANWRIHPKQQQDALTGVLEQVGYVQDVIINKTTGHLVDGHLRCQIAAKHGEKTIPCVYVELSEEEESLVLATIDPISAMAATDKAKLEELMHAVQSDNENVQKLIADIAEKERIDFGRNEVEDAEPQIDKAEELRVKWGVESGQLWQLGDHRIICGDCTDKSVINRLLGEDKPEIMITDPPYGVNLDQSWRDKALGDKALGKGNSLIVQNDNIADWTNAWELFTGDIAYIWHASKYSDVVMDSLRNCGFEICQQLIWNKSIMVMGRSDYHFKHEPCWYAVRKGKNHHWIGDRTQTTVIDAKSPNHIMSGSEEVKTEHQTQKPIDCFEMIRNHDGDIVYEPFSGSGTAIIACERLGRKCRAVEISPAYVAVAIERWATATGKEPVLLEGTG